MLSKWRRIWVKQKVQSNKIFLEQIYGLRIKCWLFSHEHDKLISYYEMIKMFDSGCLAIQSLEHRQFSVWAGILVEDELMTYTYNNIIFTLEFNT